MHDDVVAGARWARRRVAIAAALGGLALAGLANAQPDPAVPAAGSLTILSRPVGASFRMSGAREVVGRTPATLGHGLTGRFEVEGFQAGYERWRRTIQLDGTTSDTVWISLRPKRPVLASARSLVVPGWGQAYGGNPGRGWFYFALGSTAAGIYGFQHYRYRQEANQHANAVRRHQAATTPDEAAAALAALHREEAEAQQAFDRRTTAGLAAAGVWVLAAVDAAVTLRGPGNSDVQVGLMSRAGGGGDGVTLARMRF